MLRGCHRRRLVLEPREQRALLSGDLAGAVGPAEALLGQPADDVAVLAEAEDGSGSFSPAGEGVFALWNWAEPQNIPDGPGGDWVQIDFEEQVDIPLGARATEVMVYYDITHPHSGDIEVQASNGSHTWTVRDNHGGATPDISETVTEELLFAGDLAAQPWSYRVRDTVGGQTGTLNAVQLYVFYEEVLTRGEIHGVVWDDLDGDGERDANESGLANRRVHLDVNENGQWDSGEPYEGTNASGHYAFTGLPAGKYVVASYPTEDHEPTNPAPSFAGPPGPADQGTAKAWYDWRNGEFYVSVNNVRSWEFQSVALFRSGLPDDSQLPAVPSGTFVSSTGNTHGEVSFGPLLGNPDGQPPTPYTDVFIGNIFKNPPTSDVELQAIMAAGDFQFGYDIPGEGRRVGEIAIGPQAAPYEIVISQNEIVTNVDFGSHALPGKIRGVVLNYLDGNSQRDGG